MSKIKSRILSKKDQNQKMVSIFLYFGAGGKNDPKNLLGLSHFLEHIIASVDINMSMKVRYFGGERVLQTCPDYIRINHYVPREFWKENLVYVMDYLYKSQITKEKVEKEKELIIKEVNHWQSYSQNKTYWMLKNLMFYPHPYSNNGNGIPEHYRKITPEFLEYYRECFWDDILIVVAGDVEEEEVKNIVNNYIEKLDLKTNKWESEVYLLPENGQVEKPIQLDEDINFLGVGYLIKSPSIDDISSFYLLLYLLWYQDSAIKQIFKNNDFIITDCLPYLQLHDEDLLYFSMSFHLVNKTEPNNLINIWNKFAKNFDYFQEKILIYNEIMSFRSKSIFWGDYYYANRDFDELLYNMKHLDKNRFLSTFDKIDRTAIIFGER